MSAQAQQIAEMLDMLPAEEQDFACEVLRKLIRAWDPDYTRLTPAETAELTEAEDSGYIDESEIDWNNPEKYA